MVIEDLCAVPELTEPQRQIATAAVMTLNQELQTAQQRGDKTATDFMRAQQQSK